MDEAKNSLKTALWLITCAFLTLYFFDDFFVYGAGLSVDIAHHYFLASYIYDHWQIAGSDSLLKNSPYAHLLAAILGRFLGSPLAGMQWVILTSLLAIWSVLAFAIQTLPKRAFNLTASLLLILLLINGFTRLSLYGNEIVGNFFFPQLLAQAVILIAILCSLKWEKKAVNPWVRYLFLAIIVLFSEKIHLLPAITLLGFLTLSMIFDSLFVNKKQRTEFLVLCSLFLLIVIIALLTNPAFAAMRSISLNNGGIVMKHIAGLKSLFIFCILVIILSGFLLMKWLKINSKEAQKNNLLIKYLGLYGLTISGLCLLQTIMLAFGQGSEYACKKYGFGLNTLMIIDLALIISLLLKPAWFYEIKESNPRKYLLLQTIFCPILLLVIFFTILPHKTVSIANTISLIHSVEAYRDTIIQRSPPNKFNYAVGLDKSGGAIDYMISVGVLKAEPFPSPNIQDIIEQKSFTKPKQVDQLITLEGSKWDIPSCRQHVSPDSLVLLKGACVLAKMAADHKK